MGGGFLSQMRTKEEKAAYTKGWKERNKDKINAQARKRYTTDGRWEKQLKDHFGITSEYYWSLHVAQSGLCKICGKPQCVGTKLDVDHDHKTGKVRALLCRHCNAGIGLLKDDITLVSKALTYLKENA